MRRTERTEGKSFQVSLDKVAAKGKYRTIRIKHDSRLNDTPERVMGQLCSRKSERQVVAAVLRGEVNRPSALRKRIEQML
jgi:hypothetical protein